MRARLQAERLPGGAPPARRIYDRWTDMEKLANGNTGMRVQAADVRRGRAREIMGPEIMIFLD